MIRSRLVAKAVAVDRAERNHLVLMAGTAVLSLLAGIGVLATAISAARAQEPTGEQIFTTAGCAACHGAAGEGGIGPALAGNADLADADAVVRRILTGAPPMPAFAATLSDIEIALVATYIRGSWGNTHPPVDAAAVTAVRATLPPAGGAI